MELRHASHPDDVLGYSSDRIRQEFLVENLFQAGKLRMVKTQYDRVIIGGAAPTDSPLALEASDELKTDFFLERREIGFIGLEGRTVVIADGIEYDLKRWDGLYVGMGVRELAVRAAHPGTAAKVYFVSAPAHHAWPVQKLEKEKAQPLHLGSPSQSNERTILSYIHPGGMQSCQLMMGITMLKENNVWNTMPAHLHDRRMEVYLYADLHPEDRVFHFMGKPDNLRSLVVRNEQAVISPSWSIHAGAGTRHYSFIWAMAGENKTFQDVDAVPMESLR